VLLAEAAGAVAGDLETAQAALLAEATERRDARTVPVTSIEEAVEAAQIGFAAVPWWMVGEDGETRLAASGVSVRCLQRADGGLPLSDDEPDLVAICAKAY
jgi:prolyl-tRNA synthetase